MRIIIGLICLALFLIFAIQNNNLVDVRFFSFHITQIPLFSVIICVFIGGIIVGRISAWFSQIISKKKLKKD